MRTLEEVEKEISQTEAELKNVHGTETEVYSRIVGYYRAVRNWNKGKRDEFDHRKMFRMEDSTPEKEQNKPAPHENISSEPEDRYYEIYTRKTCPNCPPVKEFMKNINLKGKAVDVDSEEGLSEAAEKGVFAAPTVIVYDKNGNETARGHSVEELEVIFEKIPAKA